MNVELRMWNFELVARRAMKNYSIKNYLASYSIFLLVSPSLLGRDGRGFFIASFNHKPYGSNLFREKPRRFAPKKPIENIDMILYKVFICLSLFVWHCCLRQCEEKFMGMLKIYFHKSTKTSYIDDKVIYIQRVVF